MATLIWLPLPLCADILKSANVAEEGAENPRSVREFDHLSRRGSYMVRFAHRTAPRASTSSGLSVSRFAPRYVHPALALQRRPPDTTRRTLFVPTAQHNFEDSRSNANLNRYNDILSHTPTRVKKKPSFGGDTNDYINANRFELNLCKGYSRSVI